MQVGRAILAVRDLKPNETQDLWLPVKPLLKQDKVRPPFQATNCTPDLPGPEAGRSEQRKTTAVLLASSRRSARWTRRWYCS